jgi:cyclohexadienyl dehydratase
MPHARIIEHRDNNVIFDQLTSDAADVMIMDTSEIRLQVRQKPQLCTVSIDHPFTFEQRLI